MRILYVMPRGLHKAKTDRGRVVHGEAVGRQPGVELRFTFEDWRRLADEWSPDLLWVYDPPVRDQGIWRHTLEGISNSACPRICFYYDAYGLEKVRAEIDSVDPTLVVFAQQNDALNWWGELESEGRKVVRIPNCAEKSIFYREMDGQRPIDCLLTGALHPEVYPLRERFARLIDEGAIPGERRKFPGHRRNSLEDARKQFADYAAHLRLAKVLLVDSSVHQLFLQRYAEAAAAGCVMIGDMPDDELFRSTLGKALVEVDNDMADKQIVKVVKELLADPAEMERRRAIGLAEYLASYTTEHFAQQFVRAARAVC